MNVARLNMSHGDHEQHTERLRLLRQATELVDAEVMVFADLQGPKIRLGTFADGPVTLEAGQSFTITTEDTAGDVNRVSTTLKSLTDDVKVGDTVLIADGTLELLATEVTATDVVCKVIIGGLVSDHKGINLPGVPVSVPALSDKDADDLRWALAQNLDMVALSFVRDAKDIEPVHAIMDEVGSRLPVIAKVEKPQAIDDLEAVVGAFDAIMVARGDLGVEMPFETVPVVQKRIITTARTLAKPVIVATEMLESMMSSPRPTRAEASDVANAVLDGADAVMLSGETSVGQYPVQAVQAMDRIIRSVEAGGVDQICQIDWDPRTTSGVVAWTAARMAKQLSAAFVVAFTYLGDTARKMARLRADVPIVCFTPLASTKRRLGLVWGLRVFQSKEMKLRAMLAEMDSTLLEQGLVEFGDRVVVVYGEPLGVPAHTNTVYVHEVGQLPG